MRLLIALLLVAGNAAAQPYPSKPIKIIVPLAAGGTGDTIARLLGEELGKALGGAVIIENRPGSGGVIGTEAVAKSAADGHTLLHTSSSHVVNAALRTKLPYDPLRDFAPISRTADTYQVLLAHPSLPANTLEELIQLSKQSRILYGSAGNGSATHLNMELFKSLAGIDLEHIPYRGSTQARTDLLAGQIQLAIDGLLPTLPHIRAAKLKALAVTNSRRSAAAPEIPTIGEIVPGYQSDTWYALLAPVNVDRTIIQTLQHKTQAALASRALREKFAQQGAEPAAGGPEALDVLMRAELARWSKVVVDAHVRVD